MYYNLNNNQCNLGNNYPTPIFFDFSKFISNLNLSPNIIINQI